MVKIRIKVFVAPFEGLTVFAAATAADLSDVSNVLLSDAYH